MEAVQPLRDETGPPFAHRLRRDSELPRNHLVGIAHCAGEHDAGSQRQSPVVRRLTKLRSISSSDSLKVKTDKGRPMISAPQIRS